MSFTAPGLRKIKETFVENTFVNKIKTLLPFIENSTIKKVIFISSTSVYGDDITIPTVTEESVLQPDTESGKQLVEVENLFQNSTKFQTTIIRFGGLVGEDRNAVKMLSGKTNILNPEAPVNLIDQVDCIKIICAIICSQNNSCKVWNETFNAVAPNHPTKKIYYTQKAIDLNLPKPEFIANQPSNGKIVSSEKLMNTLKYKFNITP